MLLTLLVSSFIPTLIYSDQCPSGGVFNAQFNKCYVISTTPAPYALAEQDCINLGGHLTILNRLWFQQTLAISGLVPATSSLQGNGLGLTEQISYTPTGRQRQRRLEDCASSRLSDGRWAANECLLTKAYTCSVPPQQPFTCPPPPTCPTVTRPAPVVCTPRQCTPHCDSEWTYFSQTNSCFKVFRPKMGCAEAFYLARTNQKQSNPDELTWIGLKASGDTWKWTDNTKTDYINWAPKQPDNPGKEDCV
ncbi:hypothetical protein OSTOST_14979, partial [Ostertagia ostertagi]